MATQLDEICDGILSSVEGALGVAVVDMDSGLLLAVAQNAPYFTQTFLDVVAAGAAEMFRGRTVTNIEEMIATLRGVPVKRFVTEIQMTTDETHHFMSVVPGKNVVVVLITSKAVNLGMGWMAVRNAVAEVEPLCP
jgi:predicted regulator of Ras-like GTPase activity (Roadblock/LC7/MglB family)